jgi:FMN phosphatase YigB (HAD superfamily)
MLEKAGLVEHLDAWTSSEEARSCKPDSEIFHYSLRKARVPAAESLFIGDTPEADVLGARRLGMRTVLIQEPGVESPGSGAGASADPHHRVLGLAERLPIARGA